MNDKKIHITITDPETRNAVTSRFDTWDEAAEYIEQQRREEEKKAKKNGGDKVPA